MIQRSSYSKPATPELPSQQLPETLLPRVLRASDLTVLCLFSVLLVTNVPLIAGAGGASYIYWILGFLTFLIPSALICAQLYRLFPGEGAVYLWANKAFGSFWDTFLGFFCNWWPGALGLTIEAGAVITSLQALNPSWLGVPWQVGLAEILVLLVAQGLCLLSQQILQRILNSVFIAYSISFVFLGIAGLAWIITGHHVQGDFSAQGWQLNPGNYPVFATVIVSLLGMAVPLNMGAEVVSRRNASKYLLLGVVITIAGYLFATFGVLAVLPPKDLANPAFITEIFSAAFGPAVGTVLGILLYSIMVIYFICATAAFNLMFARLLLVAGIDRRLPSAVQKLSKQRTPMNAMFVQTGVNLLFVAILFFFAPAFAPTNAGISFAVFLVTINGASVIWNIAMIGLFLCGIILFVRNARQLAGKWIAPPIVLYTAAVAGCIAAGFSIYSTFFAGSPLPQALNNADWVYWVLLVVLGSLAIGALYSFLVPEAEDLVALIYREQGVNKPEREETTPPLLREEHYDETFPGVPSSRTTSVAGSLPTRTR